MDFFLSSGSPPCQRSTCSIQHQGTSIIPSLYPHLPQLSFPFLGLFCNPFVNSFLNFRQPPLCSSEQIPGLGLSSEQLRKLAPSTNVPPSIHGSSTITGQSTLYASEQIWGLGLSSEQLRKFAPSITVAPSIHGSSTSDQLPLCSSEQLRKLVSSPNVPPSICGSSNTTGQPTLYALEQIPGLGLSSEQLRKFSPSTTPSIYESSKTTGQSNIHASDHIPGLGLSSEQLRKLAPSTTAAPTVYKSSTMSSTGQPNSNQNLFTQESVFRVNRAEELNPKIPELISKASAFNRFRSVSTRSSIDSSEANETSLLNPKRYLTGGNATAKKSISCHQNIRFPASSTFLDQNHLSFHKNISSSIYTNTSSTLFQVIPLDTYFYFKFYLSD